MHMYIFGTPVVNFGKIPFRDCNWWVTGRFRSIRLLEYSIFQISIGLMRHFERSTNLELWNPWLWRALQRCDHQTLHFKTIHKDTYHGYTVEVSLRVSDDQYSCLTEVIVCIIQLQFLAGRSTVIMAELSSNSTANIYEACRFSRPWSWGVHQTACQNGISYRILGRTAQEP